MASRIWSLFRHESRAAQRGWRRVSLAVEQLDERIVPAAPITTWTPAGVNQLWSNAANWSGGLPDDTKVVAFTGGMVLGGTLS
jgi:hypothetical protein